MPTYPTTIDGSQAVLLFPYRSKPAYRLGGIYLPVMAYGGTRYIRMYKSLDAGDTWSELDSSNAPSVFNGASYNVVNSYTASDKAWFVYCAPGGPPPTESRVISFDYATGTWGTAITGGPVPATLTGLSSTGSLFPNAQLGIAVRSNGDIVVVHSDVKTHLYNRHTLKFSVYSSGAWGSPVKLVNSNYQASPQDGNEPNLENFNYELVGCYVGANDVVHTLSCGDYGYVYAGIKTDNTLGVYMRFDDDARINHAALQGPLNGTFWGLPALFEQCDQSFFSVPIGVWTGLNDVSNTWKPCLLTVPDSAAPKSYTFRTVQSLFLQYAANQSPVAYFQDSSTGIAYLVWRTVDDPSGDCDVLMSAAKGLEWSEPTILFSTAYGTYAAIDDIEIEVFNGVMRLVFASPTGTWYWQGSVTPTPDSCSTGPTSGNINSVR